MSLGKRDHDHELEPTIAESRLEEWLWVGRFENPDSGVALDRSAAGWFNAERPLSPRCDWALTQVRST